MIARSWVSRCDCLWTENALWSCMDWDSSQMGWNGPGCSVGQFKHFISSAILVDIFCRFIPIFWRGIRRMSVGHCSDGVLDLQVQSFLEFYYSGFGVCIPHFCKGILNCIWTYGDLVCPQLYFLSYLAGIIPSSLPSLLSSPRCSCSGSSLSPGHI